MRRSRSFLSLAGVSLEEGREIGRIKGLVIDPQTVSVAALLVQGGGIFAEQRFIPYQRVVSAGTSAVTVQKAASAERFSSLPQIAHLLKEGVQVRGARVVTEDGNLLGYVEEYHLDPETGKITTLEISKGRGNHLFRGSALLPAAAIRTLGRDVVVVHNNAPELLCWSEAKIRLHLRGLKEATARLARRTPPAAPPAGTP